MAAVVLDEIRGQELRQCSPLAPALPDELGALREACRAQRVALR